MQMNRAGHNLAPHFQNNPPTQENHLLKTRHHIQQPSTTSCKNLLLLLLLLQKMAACPPCILSMLTLPHPRKVMLSKISPCITFVTAEKV